MNDEMTHEEWLELAIIRNKSDQDKMDEIFHKIKLLEKRYEKKRSNKK